MAMPQQSAQQTSQMVVPSQTMVNLNHPPHHRMMAEPINDGCNKMESTTTTTQDGKENLQIYTKYIYTKNPFQIIKNGLFC